MSYKMHAHKQFPTTDVEPYRVFKPSRFDVQTKLDIASQPEQEAVDLPTQLSRAKRFGHNLSQVQVPVNQPIQRQAIDPEEHVLSPVALHTLQERYTAKGGTFAARAKDSFQSEFQLRSGRFLLPIEYAQTKLVR